MFEFTKVDGLPRVQRRSSRRTVANDEWLTGCFLAHPTMAKARMLRRREQSIAHGSALTATSPLGRVFLDCSHVVFPHVQSRSRPPIRGQIADRKQPGAPTIARGEIGRAHV